jgi:2-polyprenyl-3-methyl-5-hydroxy-6-metoxy-1,4-benzoquinol methylase
MDVKTLQTHLKNLSDALEFFNQILNQENLIDDAASEQKNKLVEIHELKQLLKQDVWPMAVSEELICSEQNEDDKLARAAEICKDIFKLDLEKKRILDFGCGDGHASYILATLSDAEVVVGYDINPFERKFEDTGNLLFTESLQDLKERGPFDIILAHDVIDHCEKPEEAISIMKELKKDNGKIYLRCHPWTSRHATHLYKALNKAYVHLIFSEDELYAMGIVPNFAAWCSNPTEYYQGIFDKNNLKIIQENKTKQPFELFFLTKPSILKRIRKNLKIEEKIPTEILEIQFIDYLLI